MIRALALAALGLLAACGSGGTDPIVAAAIDEVGGMWSVGRSEPAGPPPKPVRRAEIEASDTAAIFARLESDPSPTLMYAAARNGPYITFLSPHRQSITLRGSQITATRGLGTDLLSAWSSTPDPLAQPIPPARWPAAIERSFEFFDAQPLGEVRTFRCVFERGPVRDLVILEVRHRGIEFSETCTGPAGSFENLHFADAATGFVWRSLQWTGPDMDLIDLQIVEPYTGG